MNKGKMFERSFSILFFHEGQKMRKKVLSCFICILVLVSTLAGCGSRKNSDETELAFWTIDLKAN